MPGLGARRVLLLVADNASVAKVVEEALRDAGIPFDTAVRAEPEPGLAFTVRETDEDVAKAVVAQFFGAGPLTEEEAPPARREAEKAAFPRGPLAAAAILALSHLAVVIALVGPDPGAARFASLGGLVAGEPPRELWRLVTSLFIHADLRHVFWNGLSMLVFAVPLIERFGWVRTTAVYLASGILGGAAVLATSEPGTVTIGSSGAVAGLFGCWVAATVLSARNAPLPRRAVVRTVGIGLLVLPALLTPTTIGGDRVSVAAHLGGLAAGLLLGGVLRRRRIGPVGVSAAGSDPAGARFRDPTFRS
ncbi:MAG: rhomboid family intramembrane serine protease [Acidobacteriia bacterium]|nr:rhomboid family intramembrane serine protease [Terriglobia bacterium]